MVIAFAGAVDGVFEVGAFSDTFEGTFVAGLRDTFPSFEETDAVRRAARAAAFSRV
jgi:hypothetical protein